MVDELGAVVAVQAQDPKRQISLQSNLYTFFNSALDIPSMSLNLSNRYFRTRVVFSSQYVQII